MTWLHMTTYIVGFADEVPDSAIETMTDDARERLSQVAPIRVSLGRVGYASNAIVLPVEPPGVLTPVLDAVRDATRAAACDGYTDTDPWLPHISVAYSNATIAAAPIIAALRRWLPNTKITIRSISLVSRPAAYRRASAGCRASANADHPTPPRLLERGSGGCRRGLRQVRRAIAHRRAGVRGGARWPPATASPTGRGKPSAAEISFLCSSGCAGGPGAVSAAGQRFVSGGRRRHGRRSVHDLSLRHLGGRVDRMKRHADRTGYPYLPVRWGR